MISEQEWATLSLLIEEGWPGAFDDAAAKAWRMLLDGFDARQVFGALRLFVSRGGTFRPSVSEVVAEIRRDPSRPTFAEMCQLVFGRGGVLRTRAATGRSRFEPGERERLDDAAAVERAESLHPLIAAFVRSQGVPRLRQFDLNGEWAGANSKRLAEAWEEFSTAHEHREVAVLVAGRHGELGRLDPLAALSRPERTTAVLDGPHTVSEGESMERESSLIDGRVA